MAETSNEKKINKTPTLTVSHLRGIFLIEDGQIYHACLLIFVNLGEMLDDQHYSLEHIVAPAIELLDLKYQDFARDIGWPFPITKKR
ncbi:MAG: hypothetical protein ACI88H_003503 [Cocleimonas sp.]